MQEPGKKCAKKISPCCERSLQRTIAQLNYNPFSHYYKIDNFLLEMAQTRSLENEQPYDAIRTLTPTHTHISNLTQLKI